MQALRLGEGDDGGLDAEIAPNTLLPKTLKDIPRHPTPEPLTAVHAAVTLDPEGFSIIAQQEKSPLP